MEERVVVREKQSLLIVVCVIFGTFFLGILVLCLALGVKSDYNIYCWVFIPPTALFYALSLFAPFMMSHRDIYTSKKMIRMKNNKIVFEIFWEDVISISYTKPSLLGWLDFGGSYAFFIKTKKAFTDKGIQAGATMFNAHYNVKDVYKIQGVIPVSIRM